MATHVAAAEGTVVAEQSSHRPYAPSWLDALVERIERLPGPTWLVYVVLATVALAVVTLEAALSSRGLFGQDPAYFGYAIFHIYPLAAYHFLSRGAVAAWEAFRPAADCDDAAAARWRAALSTTPAKPAAVLFVVAALGYMGLLAAAPEGFDLVGHQPAFVALRVLSEAFWLAPLSWMLTYLLVRQMRIVSQLHRSVAKVDLLEPRPLHAMSTLTARSAIVLLVLQLFIFAPLPNLTESARLALFLIVVPFIGLAVAAFILPLRGMHSLLEAEKRRRQATVSARIDAALETLHRAVDEETVREPDAESSRLAQARFDGLNKAIASLLQERDLVGRLSTWPWDASTLRGVLSAVALPVLLFLLTRGLERFVL